MLAVIKVCFQLFIFLGICMIKTKSSGGPYELISRIQTECELEALQVGSALADRYNSMDEGTEWDVRLHNDYLIENLGFAPWIQEGLYKSGGKTPHKNHAPHLHKLGGWAGHKSINVSSYWALEDQWLYMMGDSTQRQVWATLVSPFASNDFERNAKNWTRENCARQAPHRKVHISDGHFPEEGWGGRCGNNEVTCDFPGFGANGQITFDWKHFAYEDYDEWLFGVHNETGKWSNDKNVRRPDILTFEVGLHTCVHGFHATGVNETLIKRHEDDIPILMKAVKTAIERQDTSSGVPTMVIVSTAGRAGNPDPRINHCTWRYNRILAHEAHKHGFVVLEREEIERRLLFKSEHYPEGGSIQSKLHLEAPSPQIIGTSLLALISCLRKNESSTFLDAKSSSLSSIPRNSTV